MARSRNPWPATVSDQVVPGLVQSAWPELHRARAYRLAVCAAADAWEHYLGDGGSVREAGAVVVLPLDDDPDRDWLRVPGWAAAVEVVADQVAAAMASGGPVLVACNQGLNRSGLVVALSLTRMGHSPSAAVRLVRDARGPRALSNDAFVAAVGALGSRAHRAAARLRRLVGSRAQERP